MAGDDFNLTNIYIFIFCKYMGRAFTILIFDLICIELPIDVSSQMSNAANKEATVQMIPIG
jgi:hypothetical protein